jgi:1-acyl-sn-glycerol-3-phosphate acyltransferase
MTMVRAISKYLLEIFGWKLSGSVPGIKKYVIIVAPHTSNWDYFFGQLFIFSTGLKAKIMIKKELFYFPLGILLRALGGIPVDRKGKTDIVDQMIRHFNVHDSFILTIAPEGTRSRVNEWKTGFHRIATGANVPVLCGFIDYKKKLIGTGKLFYLSGDTGADMAKIKRFYSNMNPRYPEKFCAL